MNVWRLRLWQPFLHTHTHTHPCSVHTKQSRPPKTMRNIPGCLFSLRQSRRGSVREALSDMCLAVYHMEPRESSGCLPPTTVWDSKWLPNTAEPRHCKGISPLCFLKQFGIKGWKKKCSVFMCVCVCVRDWSAVRRKKRERAITRTQSYFIFKV